MTGGGEGGGSPRTDRRRGRREADIALLAGCAEGLSADAPSAEAIVGDVLEVMRLMGCTAGLLAWKAAEAAGPPRVLSAFGLPLPPRGALPPALERWGRAAAEGAPPEGSTPSPLGEAVARSGSAAHLVALLRAGTYRGLLAAVRVPEVPGADRHEASVFRLLGHMAAAALDAAEREARAVRTHFADGHHALLRVLGRELARGRALEVPCGFLRVRLTGVGRLNSRRGLPAGDAAFEEVRAAIDDETAEIRGLDLVGRHLADSWAVVLPGHTRAQAAALGLRIVGAARRRLGAALPAEAAVDVSFAAAALPEDGRHIADIVRAVSDDLCFRRAPEERPAGAR